MSKEKISKVLKIVFKWGFSPVLYRQPAVSSVASSFKHIADLETLYVTLSIFFRDFLLSTSFLSVNTIHTLKIMVCLELTERKDVESKNSRKKKYSKCYKQCFKMRYVFNTTTHRWYYRRPILD